MEVVDFIIHSINDALANEFGQTLGDKNVHIIDPFTGTGTFITRLLQSGLISQQQLAYKYQHEIHANEIVLLAYYIAAINIESVYHDIMGGGYQPFNGICLADTFQLYEKEDLVSQMLVDNHARRSKQKALDIRVIMGNPPYSAGQNSANDNNANVSYPTLDNRIRTSYAEHSTATNKNALYDSYIRAIRWASDRIKDTGVIGFVSGNGFAEKPVMAGVRKCLADEFSSVYVFNLRGDIRKNMLSKGKAKEGQNVFGSGSMTGIAITLFIKKPSAQQQGKIYYYDVGDDLKENEKLQKLNSLKSINGIAAVQGWLKQRDDSFSCFMSLGDKKDKNAAVIFENYSRGAETGRDAWCYNSSKSALTKNMQGMIDFYNEEVERYKTACEGLTKDRFPKIDSFINPDATKISWTSSLKMDAVNFLQHQFKYENNIIGLYRPYSKQWTYFSGQFTHRVGQMPRIFPDSSVENRVICVSGIGARSGFSALITNTLPDLEIIEKSQCFPLHLYEPLKPDNKPTPVSSQAQQADLLDTDNSSLSSDGFDLAEGHAQPRYTIKDTITDAGLAHCQAAYPDENITKEDLFYYIYGLLHSEDYKARYADNLTKELPRIPCVAQAADFWAFSQAGRDLAEWHIHYETVEPYPLTVDCGNTAFAELTAADFYVTKMKFADKTDKSTVVYNAKITLKNIPLEAYDYIVNGKPALQWVMERQSVTTHKDSGIVNDANAWAVETMGNARYPLELLQRVITVSLATLKIVQALPPLLIRQ